MGETDSLQKVAAAQVRYIKLGPGGAWFRRCMKDGTVEFGHSSIPHELARSLDRSAIEARLLANGRSAAKAKDFSREICDFYGLGSDCLWSTIGEGRLWWAFAEPEVTLIPPAPGRGARQRSVIGRWCDHDLLGRPLTLEGLSTRLTKVAAYRQTLCRVEAEAYLLRRINGVEEPVVVEAKAARAQLIKCARSLIQQLDWRDFELLVDLIFSDGGWRRASAVGGSDQADTDLILEHPTTGETAFVQVKSRAAPAMLADYIERFRASGFDRMFFVCHSPVGALACDAPDVHLWLGERLAEQTVRAGLFDWLVEKAR